MYCCIESYWKKYKKYISSWQENYIEKVNKEIVLILLENKNPSFKFWEVNDFIHKSKQNPGVLITDSRRNNLGEIMISLVINKVITRKDVDDFSIELKECLEPYFKKYYDEN